MGRPDATDLRPRRAGVPRAAARGGGCSRSSTRRRIGLCGAGADRANLRCLRERGRLKGCSTSEKRPSVGYCVSSVKRIDNGHEAAGEHGHVETMLRRALVNALLLGREQVDEERGQVMPALEDLGRVPIAPAAAAAVREQHQTLHSGRGPRLPSSVVSSTRTGIGVSRMPSGGNNSSLPLLPMLGCGKSTSNLTPPEGSVMKQRSFLLGVTAGLVLALGAVTLAADNNIGTWKLASQSPSSVRARRPRARPSRSRHGGRTA